MNQEYTEVNNNIRHYSNMRFAQLTIYVAITGVLINFFFNKVDTLKSVTKFCFEIGGIYIAIMFWIMEKSATKKWKAFKARAIELEKELGYKQITNFPSSALFSATNATQMLFLGGILFWAITICTFYNC